MNPLMTPIVVSNSEINVKSNDVIRIDLQLNGITANDSTQSQSVRRSLSSISNLETSEGLHRSYSESSSAKLC